MESRARGVDEVDLSILEEQSNRNKFTDLWGNFTKLAAPVPFLYEGISIHSDSQPFTRLTGMATRKAHNFILHLGSGSHNILTSFDSIDK